MPPTPVGITSADASDTVMYVTDRSAKMLDIVDLQTHGIIARAPLASERLRARRTGNERSLGYRARQ
jgi:hypothetical protein